MVDSAYGGLIWTNHALARSTQRGLSQELVWDAFRHPDRTENGKDNSTVFFKKHSTSLITVIAKQNNRQEWIIISAWVNPPLPGSIDEKSKQEYYKYQKAGFWGKFFLTLKRQLGL